MDDSTLFMICVIAAASFGGYFVSRLLLARDGGRLRERLANGPAQVPGASRTPLGGPHGAARVRQAFQRLGTAAARPFMPDSREKMSALRAKLSRAGIYTPAAFRTVTGMKVICLATGVIAGYALGALLDNLLLGLSLGGLSGYMAPALWLNLQIKVQQKALDHALPDALDLMCVCIEAGLAVDAAMQRVGEELAIAHPRLSREFEIVHAETRLGLSRADALRNLGVRTGAPALQALGSMLIQAERFGTSIASALRVHGESLRAQRQFKAEELAAKASVKMSFPLVLFIFPATFIILAGPTVIGLMRSSMFND